MVNAIIFLSICYSLIYAVAIFRLLSKEIWNRKSDIKSVQDQNQIIKNWSLFLFGCMAIMMVGRILAWVFLSPINDQFFYIENLTWFSALLWLTIYSIVLIKPEILYGYRYLQKIADYTSEKSFFSTDIWHLEQPNKAMLSQKDLMLSEKIISFIPSYIHNLENISLNTDFFRKPECTTNELASELKIPISHLNYLFKYHCNHSFVDYRKIVRIYDAANLIKQGYVKNNTIESLATLVGFVTYSTFSIAFKEITGNTAQEYVEEKNMALAG